jgi:predicted PurR-regulated permease PerM
LRLSSIPLTPVVIDNGSQDETVAYIRAHFPEAILLEQKQNLGFGQGNNVGIRYALQHDATHVLLLNQDAWIEANMVEKLLADMPKNLDAILDTTVSFGKSIASWVIGATFAIYFLIDKDRLKNAGSTLLRSFVLDRTYRNYVVFWERSNQILIRYIVYDVLDGLIIGVTNWFFMAVADMPYGLLISVVVGVTNLAPTFGPIVGGAIGAFILVLINPWYALTFLIFTIVLQTVDGYILKPKLFASTLGVSGVWILICIVVGGRMFGVGGILLAIPFAAIMDYIYKESILVSLAERKARREEWYSAENEKKEEKTDQIDGEEDSSEEEDTDVEEADVDDVEAEDAEAEDVGDPE